MSLLHFLLYFFLWKNNQRSFLKAQTRHYFIELHILSCPITPSFCSRFSPRANNCTGLVYFSCLFSGINIYIIFFLSLNILKCRCVFGLKLLTKPTSVSQSCATGHTVIVQSCMQCMFYLQIQGFLCGLWGFRERLSTLMSYANWIVISTWDNL